ncbi:MAG: pyrimidine-nucleoside phosphorylase [Spirochaetia bacterium]
MRITDIIHKKRGGEELSREEIEFFVTGYVGDEIPDYQISALLMAIWFQGMGPRETADLTMVMADSGDRIDLSGIPGIKVDKHSTGGVADTTTLVVAPLVAACGGRVAKMSGRGLGHTGGTLDKLESIPGLSVSQSMDDFVRIVNTHGLSVIGQTGNLAPADKKLYALRDVTATVDNLSLIASSIMSKKLAAGSDAIVLDVKTGSGAFMKELGAAVELAEAMVEIGKNAGRKTTALVTDMNQPLGNAVGNALEVKEAVEILQGRHPGDLKEVSLALAARMLLLSEAAEDENDARQRLEAVIDDGTALAKLAAMIEAQGGDPQITEDTDRLPAASKTVVLEAKRPGRIEAMDTEEIGYAAMLLGAGRAAKDDTIDLSVGIWMSRRIGDEIRAGDELAVFHVNDETNLDEAMRRFEGALKITGGPADKPTLIYRSI